MLNNPADIIECLYYFLLLQVTQESEAFSCSTHSFLPSADRWKTKLNFSNTKKCLKRNSKKIDVFLGKYLQ